MSKQTNRSQPRLRRGEHGGALQVVLAIIGGIIALVVLCVLVSVWAVSRFVHIEVDHSGGHKRVEISTPFGGVTVEAAEDIARELKLPVYPDAWPDDESASVRLWGEVGSERGGLDITVAKFRTRDSLEQVEQYYREQLGSEYERKEGKFTVSAFEHWRGRTSIEFDGVVFVDESPGRIRGVGLEPKWSRVEIKLFDVREEGEQ